MRLPRTLSLLVPAASLVTACSDRVAPQPDLLIRTDSARYASQGALGAWVWVSIVNVSSHPVVLAGCGGFDVFPQIEEERGAEWLVVDTPACSRSYHPLEIEPGHGIGVGVLPKAVGSYRVRAPLFEDGQHVTRSPETSPVFVVY